MADGVKDQKREMERCKVGGQGDGHRQKRKGMIRTERRRMRRLKKRRR